MPNIYTQASQRFFFILCALGVLILLCGGCASQISTEDIRRDLLAGDYASLDEGLVKVYEKRPVMLNALNLGRFYQLEGEWEKSKKYFDESIAMLEDYEQRAIINVRNVGSNVAAVTFSRASLENFGTGYERSLMHTFNGLNYLMLDDFQGAAVEMRRMEKRQELWLEEADHRLRKRLESQTKEQAGNSGYSGESLPNGYSMREILSNPELREIVNTYQDPFSYALSAVVCRIAGDSDYAQVSLNRACQLDERAYQMFRSFWQRPKVDILEEVASSQRWVPKVLPLPRHYVAGSANNPATQEVVFVYLGGLGPAMKMESIRIPQPNVGYLLVDLPSFVPELPAILPKISLSEGEIKAYPLLRTDLLAYRNLHDEIGYEVASAISRAIFRAAVAFAGQTLASSDNDEEDSSPLVGFLLTLGMDVYANNSNKTVGNWELLPARGYLGLAELPRGASITLTFSNNDYTINIPVEARGIIVLVSQVEQNNLRMDYVTY